MDLSSRLEQRRAQGAPPLLFAHRGLRATAPENTLPAFAAALEAGADGIELDTHLSRDGQVVVLHDFDIALSASRRVPVGRLSRAEIQSLDAGAYFGQQFRNTRIPTLRQALELAAERLLVDIELKARGLWGAPLARAVARVVRESGLAGQLFVSSFNPLALRAFHDAAPEVPTGLLYLRTMPGNPGLRLWRRVSRAHLLMPEKGLVTPAHLAWLRGRSPSVFAWVVNDPAQGRRLAGMGVDALITDEVPALRRALGPSGETRESLP